MSNPDFQIVQEVIPHQSALEALVLPTPKDSTVIEVDYSVAGTSTTLTFNDLLDTHVVNLINVSGISPEITLPSNDILIYLFRNPQEKSVLEWIFETDDFSGNLIINWDNGSTTIAAGLWKLYLQVVTLSDTLVATFKVYVQGTVSSLALPAPGIVPISGNGTFSSGSLNISDSSAPQVTFTNNGVVSGAALTLDIASAYWLKLFGASRMPGTTANDTTRVVIRLILTNVCGQTITFVNSATSTHNMAPIQNNAVYETYWNFTGTTTSSGVGPTSASSLQISGSEITF